MNVPQASPIADKAGLRLIPGVRTGNVNIALCYIAPDVPVDLLYNSNDYAMLQYLLKFLRTSPLSSPLCQVALIACNPEVDAAVLGTAFFGAVVGHRMLLTIPLGLEAARVLCNCETIKEANPYARNSPLHHVDLFEFTRPETEQIVTSKLPSLIAVRRQNGRKMPIRYGITVYPTFRYTSTRSSPLYVRN